MKNKIMARKFFFILFLCSLNSIKSQVYSFEKYNQDKKILGKMNILIKSNKKDSLEYFLKKYNNRLGSDYYFFCAIVNSNNNNGIKFVDSAFGRGLSITCAKDFKLYFNYDSIKKSYNNNFLKLLDRALIDTLKTLNILDQKYRREYAGLKDLVEKNNKLKSKGNGNDASFYNKENTKIKLRIDSLGKAQNLLDSLNFIKLLTIINQRGWPSAKYIGSESCIDYEKPNPNYIIQHLGYKKIDFQKELLLKVILLCEKNEESWEMPKNLLFNIYHRNRFVESDFFMLKVVHNKLNKLENSFPISLMAEILTFKPNENIIIKCNNEKLFNQIKNQMIEEGITISLEAITRIYKEIGRPLPKHLTSNRFKFIKDNNLNLNQIIYKFQVVE